ncbi:MAG: hypothetical protein B7Z66_05925 [Chromatiales bacterium 21-64-14]|nr:MAG: hypothetical protein B7Z66_05925 [Chromatiales bacterium 21-64-14]HQU15158.1 HD-GYP domain-containing protein [Gammaproteobacteria bacterium]
MGEKIKVDIQDLRIGMYVVELDRPWLETPFPFQGFYLNSARAIEAVRQVCEYVFVDCQPRVRRGQSAAVGDVPAAAAPVGAARDPVPIGISPDVLARLSLGHSGTPVYRDRTTFQQEIPRACKLRAEGRALITQVFRDVRLGRSLEPGDAKALVRGLVESILDNPDALVWLTQLKSRDEYTSLHCLNVSILTLAYGRQLGLSKEALYEVGLGALLHDIGKMRVPLEILNKPGRLNPEEFAVVKTHAGAGHEILRVHSGLPDSVLDVVYGHHERRDGSGYPRNLRGDQIGLYSRMVAIVDVYDAVTSDRVYHDAASPVETLKWMYESREKLFDPWLMEQFIQCVGIFPVGSVVEMTTGEVGVVVSDNHLRRLRPRVLMVLDPDKARREAPQVVDLMERRRDGAGRPFDVRLVLVPGAYGIHPQDYLTPERVAAGGS